MNRLEDPNAADFSQEQVYISIWIRLFTKAVFQSRSRWWSDRDVELPVACSFVKIRLVSLWKHIFDKCMWFTRYTIHWDSKWRLQNKKNTSCFRLQVSFNKFDIIHSKKWDKTNICVCLCEITTAWEWSRVHRQQVKLWYRQVICNKAIYCSLYITKQGLISWKSWIVTLRSE